MNEKEITEALEKTNGNITQAGRLLDYSKQYMFNLVEQFELSEYARELRVKAKGRAFGRP